MEEQATTLTLASTLGWLFGVYCGIMAFLMIPILTLAFLRNAPWFTAVLAAVALFLYTLACIIATPPFYQHMFLQGGVRLSKPLRVVAALALFFVANICALYGAIFQIAL